MGIIANFFNAVSEEERDGISLGVQTPQWELTRPSSLPDFLHALCDLLPPESILYLEGGSPTEELKEFLKTHSIPEVTHLAMGTIWPKPSVYHLSVREDELCQLAKIVRNCAWPEVASHIHAYQNDTVLLQWFDSFSDPLYVSQKVSEDRLAAFCKRLSLEYKSDNEGIEQENSG